MQNLIHLITKQNIEIYVQNWKDRTQQLINFVSETRKFKGFIFQKIPKP
jgi:hypothetical protein